MAVSTTLNLKLSPPIQILAFGAIIIGWLSGFFYLVLGWTSGYMSVGSIVFITSQAVLPFLWLAAALWFTWGNYKKLLHRLLVAGIIAELGFVVFQTLASVENIIRLKFFPPYTSPGDSSWLAAFGEPWLVDAIGLSLFVVLLVLVKVRKRA
jgi:hypothetical protein